MGIPARDVGGLEPRHVLVLDDDVLENLIQGGADVDVAVGIGGAVVEDELGLALVAGHHFVVKVVGMHLFEHVRFPFGQARPHGEVRLGKVDGLVVIHILGSSCFLVVRFAIWRRH